MVLADVPPWIVWYLTNSCNLRCSYCFTNSSPNSPASLPPHELFSIAESLAKSAATHVTLEGGEPLVVPEFSAILDLLLAAGKRVRILTNGLLLPQLWQSNWVGIDQISISLDDIRRAKHNAQRGGYDGVMRTLRMLSEEGVAYEVVILVTSGNYDGVYATVRYLVESGCRSVSVGLPRAIGRGAIGEFGLGTGQTESVVRQLLLAHSHFGDRTKIHASGFYDRRLFTAGIAGTLTSCLCGHVKATVNYDGLVYPCSNLPYAFPKDFIHAQFGEPLSLLEHDLSDIVNGKLMDSWRAVVLSQPVDCDGCDLKLYCNGGCRALSYRYQRSFDRKDEACGLN